MRKINVLDKQVAELIAAGEVIERPSSVAKELLENAIDAGATAITIEIKRGGVSFLRVTDNGHGLEQEDVPFAFLRHATSKVRTQQDLDQIGTLGFRGEALASICAVSQIEMVTRTAEQVLGCRIQIEGGETVLLEEAGCPQGSTIIVRDLFYNIPARRKFLKKDVTEGNAVQGIVDKIALSHPEISFRMMKDNKHVLHTPGDGKLLSAIYAIFGREFAKGLLPVEYQHQGIQVSGFVTKPATSRAKRTMQHFFVNERYVKSRTCMASLEEAYKHTLMVGKFPGCVLKLNLNPSQVDVNVHPAKIEIRFVNERPVFEAVYFAVKTALDQEDNLQPSTQSKKSQVSVSSFQNEESVQTRLQTSNVQEQSKMDGVKRISAQQYRSLTTDFQPVLREPETVYQTSPIKSQSQQKHSYDQKEDVDDSLKALQEEAFQYLDVSAFTKTDSNESLQPSSTDELETQISKDLLLESKEDSTQVHEEAFQYLDASVFTNTKAQSSKQLSTDEVEAEISKDSPEESEDVSIRVIGELFKTYILLEVNDCFIMMDKHAAHERILYERFKQQFNLQQSQLLLTPLRLTITPEQSDVVSQNLSLFEQFGFMITCESRRLSITQAPLVLLHYDLCAMIEELIESIQKQKQDLTPHAFEELLHSMACRAAIKANEEHSLEELTQLAEQVYFDRSIRHCPHGRPVGITMTKYEIEKQFGRHS